MKNYSPPRVVDLGTVAANTLVQSTRTVNGTKNTLSDRDAQLGITEFFGPGTPIRP